MKKSTVWRWVVSLIAMALIGALISLGTEMFNAARTPDTMRLAFFKGMVMVGGAATVAGLTFALINILVPYSSRRNKRIRWTCKGLVFGAFNAFASASVLGSDARLPTLESLFWNAAPLGLICFLLSLARLDDEENEWRLKSEHPATR